MNERDTEFGPDDAKIAALYRDASHDEPPAALDAAVLRNARRAVTPRTAKPRTSWWMPWRVPFAFAAVAVLSVSIVLVAEREGGAPMKLEEREAPQAAARALEPPATTAAREAPAPAAEAQPAAEPKPAPPPPAVEARAKTAPAATAPSAVDARITENQTPEPERAREAATAKAKAEGEVEARRAERDSADRIQAFAKRRAEDSKVMRDEPAAQPPFASAPPAAPREAAPAATLSAPASVSERAASTPAAGASAPAAAPAMRPYAAPAAKPLGQQRRADVAQAMTPAVAALAAELDKRPPAEWLARIAQLRREGRAADADGLLAEFKRRFPEEPVPPAER